MTPDREEALRLARLYVAGEFVTDDELNVTVALFSCALLALAADLEAAEADGAMDRENARAALARAEAAERERDEARYMAERWPDKAIEIRKRAEAAERDLATAREALDDIAHDARMSGTMMAHRAADALRSLDGEPTTQAAGEGR